jgi:hypothetical protein
MGKLTPQTIVQDLVRDLLAPASTGVTIPSASSTFTNEQTLVYGSGWNTTNTFIIGYVQNNTTGEIYTAYMENAIGLGIGENESAIPENKGFAAYPNPFNSTLYIDAPVKAIQKAQIMDISGKLVKELSLENAKPYGMPKLRHHPVSTSFASQTE